MSLELYLKETEVLAKRQVALLDEARAKLMANNHLTPLEESGVLHALQILIENAIGKAKHILKQAKEPIPTSAYDTMQSLVRIGQMPANSAHEWAAIIGLRNRIVHEYMNLDIGKVMEVVSRQYYQFVVEFLLAPVVVKKN
jgi:uncharacterized protein YutE (UPF0331/DUF86 family)